MLGATLLPGELVKDGHHVILSDLRLLIGFPIFLCFFLNLSLVLLSIILILIFFALSTRFFRVGVTIEASLFAQLEEESWDLLVGVVWRKSVRPTDNLVFDVALAVFIPVVC